MGRRMIGRVAFVLVGKGLAFLCCEDGVPVLTLGLQQFDDAIVGGDGEGSGVDDTGIPLAPVARLTVTGAWLVTVGRMK